MAPMGHVNGAICQDVPVQRPLAPQPVVLSGQIIAYYGLMCASRSLPPLYELCSRSLPFDLCSGPGPGRSPIYSVCLCPPCRLPYPDGLCGCIWLLLHRTHWPSPHLHRLGIHFPTHEVPAWLCNEAAKFPLWYGPMSLLALHRQGRLRSSFHLLSRLIETSNITTRANSQFPAAGLSPARHTALWAANRWTQKQIFS